MCDIIDRLEAEIVAGRLIPKPETDGEYGVKGWGNEARRTGSGLLHSELQGQVEAPPEGRDSIGVEARIRATGVDRELRHSWFKAALPACYGEGSCNFTTIGGVFVMLGVAVRDGRGAYRKV